MLWSTCLFLVLQSLQATTDKQQIRPAVMVAGSDYGVVFLPGFVTWPSPPLADCLQCGWHWLLLQSFLRPNLAHIFPQTSSGQGRGAVWWDGPWEDSRGLGLCDCQSLSNKTGENNVSKETGLQQVVLAGAGSGSILWLPLAGFWEWLISCIMLGTCFPTLSSQQWQLLWVVCISCVTLSRVGWQPYSKLMYEDALNTWAMTNP